MKKIDFDSVRIFSFSERGFCLAKKIESDFLKNARIFLCRGENRAVAKVESEKAFLEIGKRLLIFVGAAGIAVRTIAPFLRSKMRDPAVICIDECGKFVVSILSGHVGGANDATKKIAQFLGANAVITTATDSNGIFAVDEWAEKNDFSIENPQKIKKISAKMLEKNSIFVFVQSSLENLSEIQSFFYENPERFVLQKNPSFAELLILDSKFDSNDFVENEIQKSDALKIVRKNVCVGIGCKRGVACEVLADFAHDVLRENKIREKSVRFLASVDKKADEKAILDFAQKINAPFLTFCARDLQNVLGDFCESAFVLQNVGVGNVCERAAAKAAGGDKETIFVQKTAKNGVTLALAFVAEAEKK